MADDPDGEASPNARRRQSPNCFGPRSAACDSLDYVDMLGITPSNGRSRKDFFRPHQKRLRCVLLQSGNLLGLLQLVFRTVSVPNHLVAVIPMFG